MDYTKITKLQNMGNTCYLNSVLQLIFKCEILNEHLINIDYKDNNVIKGYIKTIKDYYNPAIHTLGPKIIYNHIKNKYSQFDNYAQSDAHEFLICLFDLLETNYDKLYKNKLFNKLFDCGIKSKITCGETGEEFISQESDKVLCLSIPVEKQNITLYNCISSFFQKELLKDDNKYFNDKINKYVMATKEYFITNFPKYFFITLKKYDKAYNKIDCDVNIPYNLILKNHNYKLKGFIIQMGGLNGGHYVAYININNKWFLCDDRNITNFNINDIVKKSYILLYEKID